MTTMDALYRGELRPMEQATQNPECLQADRDVDEMQEKLRRRLSEEDYAMVEELVNLIAVAQVLENGEYYKRGLSAGLLLMQEAQQVMDQTTAAGDAEPHP